MPESSIRIVTAEEQSNQEQSPALPTGQFNLFTGALEPLPIEVPDPP
jgi:hypothetical protein